MKLRRRLAKFNDQIAVAATKRIGTMWCVYAFIIFALIPVIAPRYDTVVQYVSSAFLQLVFLPLIMVGQEVMGRATEQRARQDHEALLEALRRLEQIHQDLADEGECSHEH